MLSEALKSVSSTHEVFGIRVRLGIWPKSVLRTERFVTRRRVLPTNSPKFGARLDTNLPPLFAVTVKGAV